ncbi:MAG: N-acetyltransferase [Dysgonomonas sp.]|nr:N-acetyltransferase [Dysgonomonas sp.]
MNIQEIQIKETTEKDLNDILKVQSIGFGYDKEAELTARLLADKTAEPHLSLLAFYEGEAVGHILFTKAHIEGDEENTVVHILAPLAVIPAFQKMGIGGLLIKHGLDILKKRGSKMVFVLGHKEYYPRHGFVQNAQGMGYPPPLPRPVPAEHADYWMVYRLTDEPAAQGRIICADTLYEIEHWREDEGDR